MSWKSGKFRPNQESKPISPDFQSDALTTKHWADSEWQLLRYTRVKHLTWRNPYEFSPFFTMIKWM